MSIVYNEIKDLLEQECVEKFENNYICKKDMLNKVITCLSDNELQYSIIDNPSPDMTGGNHCVAWKEGLDLYLVGWTYKN